MKLYRFERRYDLQEDPHNSDFSIKANKRVICAEYDVVKETNSCWTIKDQFAKRGIRVVRKKARRAFAYADKQAALTNYLLRTEKYISILKDQIAETEEYLQFAKKIQITNENE